MGTTTLICGTRDILGARPGGIRGAEPAERTPDAPPVAHRHPPGEPDPERRWGLRRRRPAPGPDRVHRVLRDRLGLGVEVDVGAAGGIELRADVRRLAQAFG